MESAMSLKPFFLSTLFCLPARIEMSVVSDPSRSGHLKRLARGASALRTSHLDNYVYIFLLVSHLHDHQIAITRSHIILHLKQFSGF